MKISLEEQKNIRDRYSEKVIGKILGPGSDVISKDSETEIISESPQNRYVTGILYGLSKKKKKTDVREQLEEDFDAESDPVIVDNSFKPNSMGISFYCTETNQINVKIETAIYKTIKNPPIYIDPKYFLNVKNLIEKNDSLSKIIQIDLENNTIAYADDFKTKIDEYQNELLKVADSLDKNDPVGVYLKKLYNLNYKGRRHSKNCYQRIPIKVDCVVDVNQKNSSQDLKDNDQDLGLKLYTKCHRLDLRKKAENSIISVTLVLQNISEVSYFQSKMSVDTEESWNFVASEAVQLPDVDKLDEEDAQLLFEYQNKQTFAFGHGVSAEWKFIDSKVTQVYTSYLPTYEIEPLDYNIDGIGSDILRPDSYLENVPVSDQIEKLNKFVDQYDKWIDNLEKKKEMQTVRASRFEKFASNNIEKCRRASARMRLGIKTIETDSKVRKAFCLANEAILLQRSKNLALKVECFNENNYDKIQNNSKTTFKWRPFQLAFILTTLESLVNPESKDRDKLDLIWVTTGGGKTEAYLFNIAVVILFQRLTDDKAQGVSVLMRYTLRLLTAQQFQRACAMTCALEFLRQNRTDLGSYPISIGLWVGGKTTPNKRSEAKKMFKKMYGASSLDSALNNNEFQIVECPWCHEKGSITPSTGSQFNDPADWGYLPPQNNGIDLLCKNKACLFHAQLPIWIIDESIYKKRPTIIFGTVDKFAQVAINEDTNSLFNTTDKKTGKQYIPQLVIQDELHLISGPLGSIVGLYEAGFDYVLQQNNSRPKYIASTATIRNSRDQIKNLYDREVEQFPPSGLSVDDSFFVKTKDEDNFENKFGRLYFGIMGTGKSQVTTEIRLLGAMIASIKELGLKDAEQEDLFWTIVGYFNSIRELGKASTLLMDDVRDELNRLKRRNGFLGRQLSEQGNLELTSRIPGNEITDTMKKLDQVHEIKKENGKLIDTGIDTVIATNMISVGIDISRLNNMLVVGQPKLTSEYIQATSRVGRNTLGAVFTLYNATRSRDRSHYETFMSYHQSMYRYVEPSSVTPFSQPAMDKAVAAVIVIMLRHTVTDLLPQDSAGKIVDYSKQLQSVCDFLNNRIKNNDADGLYFEKAKQIVKEFVDKWKGLAIKAKEDSSILSYYAGFKRDKDKQLFLLESYDSKQDPNFNITKVMNSMRDIEATSNIEIKENTDYGASSKF